MSKGLADKIDIMEQRASDRHIELIKAIGETNSKLGIIERTVSDHSDSIKKLDERTQRHEQLVQKGQGASWMLNIAYVLISSSVGIAAVRFLFPKLITPKLSYEQPVYQEVRYDNR